MAYRVCHLIDSSLDTPYFRAIARLHDRQRFPVTIGSLAPAGSLQDRMRQLDVPTFSLGARSGLQYAFALWQLTRMLKQEKAVVLHAHCFDPTWVGLAAAKLARVPFVFTRHHANHHIRLGKRWHIRVDGFCARHADHVIAVSNETKAIMTTVERVPPDNITVVYNGMEPMLPPAEARVAKTRSDLGLGAEPVCLVLARLHEEKGHRFLFAAIPAIRARVGPVTVLLAGAGPERQRLEDIVKQQGLGASVRFLGRRQDVPELIALATVVVLPSLAESFGFALVEAMNLGKPVVASRIGGIPEVVADGETGLIVPPSDADALANAIVRILENPTWATELGHKARLRAAFFSVDRMLRGYEAVYESVLTSRHRLHRTRPS